MTEYRLFHKAPRVIPDKVPAQQIGIVVEGFNRVMALPKALNYFYQMFLETTSTLLLKTDFDWEYPD